MTQQKVFPLNDLQHPDMLRLIEILEEAGAFEGVEGEKTHTAIGQYQVMVANWDRIQVWDWTLNNQRDSNGYSLNKLLFVMEPQENDYKIVQVSIADVSRIVAEVA